MPASERCPWPAIVSWQKAALLLRHHDTLLVASEPKALVVGAPIDSDSAVGRSPDARALSGRCRTKKPTTRRFLQAEIARVPAELADLYACRRSVRFLRPSKRPTTRSPPIRRHPRARCVLKSFAPGGSLAALRLDCDAGWARCYRAAWTRRRLCAWVISRVSVMPTFSAVHRPGDPLGG